MSNSKKISNKDIAHLLRSVAAVYLLKGVNRFRIIAYENAADAVEHLNREINDIWENHELQNIHSIGPSISANLEEYFQKGDNSYLVKTISAVSPAVFELMKVPGIGAKKAYKLSTALKLEKGKSAIGDLLKAARNDKISSLETFGKKSQEEIIKAIELYQNTSEKEDRMSLPVAYELAQEVIDYLKKHAAVKQIDALGSLRRMVATIGDVDLACAAEPKDTAGIISHFITFPGVVKTEGQGQRKASIMLANGRRVDLYIASRATYGAMLQFLTGSKAHNIRLREYALKKGYSLSEYGIGDKKEKGTVGRSRTFRKEEEFYHFLGLQYPPPEIREGTNEIELAIKKKLPRLVETADIKGEFHVHSNFPIEPSHDLGQDTLTELAKKAKSLDYEYIGISDHNPSQNNHTHEQIVAIMQKRSDTFKKTKTIIPFFVSCEVDILPSGEIAIPDAALEYVDMIIVSIHSSFRQDKQTMTKRILRALSYPKVKILGHPTGRMLPRREEIEADWPAIFAECKKRNIALEINCWPGRLDLPDTLVREAHDAGCQFVVNTDAHRKEEMDNMFYGVSVARRGWLEKNDIINIGSYSDVKNWIDKK